MATVQDVPEGTITGGEPLSAREERRQLLRQGGFVLCVLTLLFAASLICRLPHSGKYSSNPCSWASINTLIAVDNFQKAGFLNCRGIMISAPPSVECPTFDRRGAYVSYPPGAYYLIYLVSEITGIPPSLALLSYVSSFWHWVMALSVACTVLLVWPRGVRGAGLMALLAGSVVLLHPVGMVWMFQFYFAEVPGVALLSVLVALEALRARYPGTRHIALWQGLVLACGAFTHWVFLPAGCFLLFLRLESTGFRDMGRSVKRLSLEVLLPVFLPVAGYVGYITGMGWFGDLLRKALQRMYMSRFIGSGRSEPARIWLSEGVEKPVVDAAFWHVQFRYGPVVAGVLFASFVLLVLAYLTHCLIAFRRRRQEPPALTGTEGFAFLRPVLLGVVACVSTWTLLIGHMAIHAFGSLYWLAWLGFLYALFPVVIRAVVYALARAVGAGAWLRGRLSGMPRLRQAAWAVFVAAWFVFGIRAVSQELRRASFYYMGSFYQEEFLAKALGKRLTYDDVVFSPDTAWFPESVMDETEEYRELCSVRVYSAGKYLSGKCIYPVQTPEDFRIRLKELALPPDARVNLLFSRKPAPEWEALLSGLPMTHLGWCMLYRLPDPGK